MLRPLEVSSPHLPFDAAYVLEEAYDFGRMHRKIGRLPEPFSLIVVFSCTYGLLEESFYQQLVVQYQRGYYAGPR